MVNDFQRPVVQRGGEQETLLHIRGEWNVLGSGGLSFPGSRAGSAVGRSGSSLSPLSQDVRGSVTKVTAMPHGGPAGARAGAAVATHPEFP